MFFSEKEKGLNNNYRRSAGRGGASKRIIQNMKKNPFSHTNAFKSNNFEFAGKTETR